MDQWGSLCGECAMMTKQERYEAGSRMGTSKTQWLTLERKNSGNWQTNEAGAVIDVPPGKQHPGLNCGRDGLAEAIVRISEKKS